MSWTPNVMAQPPNVHAGICPMHTPNPLACTFAEVGRMPEWPPYSLRHTHICMHARQLACVHMHGLSSRACLIHNRTNVLPASNPIYLHVTGTPSTSRPESIAMCVPFVHVANYCPNTSWSPWPTHMLLCVSPRHTEEKNNQIISFLTVHALW